MNVLSTTAFSGLEESARVVVRDATEWERYREPLAGGPAAGSPAVDFATEMVIVVAMGRRPTGGYSIEVDSVVSSDASLLVAVTETAPGRTCMTTQAFTAPAAAVRVPRFEGPVRFAEATRTRECS
jgi:hypothetical protein